MSTYHIVFDTPQLADIWDSFPTDIAAYVAAYKAISEQPYPPANGRDVATCATVYKTYDGTGVLGFHGRVNELGEVDFIEE